MGMRRHLLAADHAGTHQPSAAAPGRARPLSSRIVVLQPLGREEPRPKAECLQRSSLSYAARSATRSGLRGGTSARQTRCRRSPTELTVGAGRPDTPLLIDIYTTAARDAAESERRIYALAAWRES